MNVKFVEQIMHTQLKVQSKCKSVRGAETWVKHHPNSRLVQILNDITINYIHVTLHRRRRSEHTFPRDDFDVDDDDDIVCFSFFLFASINYEK